MSCASLLLTRPSYKRASKEVYVLGTHCFFNALLSDCVAQFVSNPYPWIAFKLRRAICGKTFPLEFIKTASRNLRLNRTTLFICVITASSYLRQYFAQWLR
jgi:hypothetical protein